jgi:fructokinase
MDVPEGRVVVVGEALIDLLADPAGGVTAAPGGGPYNTARALAVLGTPTTFAGRLSGDVFGRRLAAGLTGTGVKLLDPRPVGLPTTLALVEVDASGVASYDFYWEATSATVLGEADLASILDPAPAAVHVGTLGLLLEPTGSLTEELVGRLGPGTVLMVDPNCRPRATPDLDAYRARLQRIFGRADVIKASVDDLSYLYPEEEPLEAAARLARSVPVVLVTGGAAGAWMFTGSDCHREPGVAVEIVDTVGAGDTFSGAFLNHLLSSGGGRSLTDADRLREALRRAVVAAGICCTRAGAVPPDGVELDAAMSGAL